MMESGKDYFNALTGVRAIAAYMVFVHHYSPFSETRFGKWIFDFTAEFYAGVTIFFVLSGFLITYRYFDIEKFSFRKYMVNRFARIYPMYFILTLATFIVMLILKKGESNLTILFLNLSFLNGFFDGTKFYEILQGWTLTVEEMFYLLAPLFFLLIKRAKFYLAILPFGFLLAGIVLAKVFSKIDLDGFLSSSEFMLQRTFFGRCFEFFIGIGLAIVYKKRISVMQNYHFTYAGMTMIIACLFVMTVLRGSHEYGIQHPLGKVINSLVLPLAGISLFFYGLLTEQTFISKILGGKFFVLIGKSSYVFYLIHIGIIASFIQKIIPNAIVIFFAINLISILLYKYVEEPLSRIVRTRLGSQSLKL